MKRHNRPESILIVDDNEFLVYGMKRFFRGDFGDVSVAATGHDAVTALRLRPYDVVTLDIGLPDIDGLELLAYIKHLYPESIVVVVSSRTDRKAKERAFTNGAFGFFEKPVDIIMLKKILTAPVPEKRYPIVFDDGVTGTTCYASDNSLCITSEACLEYGALLNITLSLPDSQSIQLKGRVVRTNDWIAGLPGSPDSAGMKQMFRVELVETPPLYQSLLGRRQHG